MIKPSFLLIFLIFVSANVLAKDSSGAGNGGDALVCKDSPDYGDSVLLLDTHEAIKRRLKLNLNPTNLKTPRLRDLVKASVTRLAKKDSITAEMLYNYAMEMINDIEIMGTGIRPKSVYIGNDVVGEINDSLHVTVPIGCEIRQLVSQKVPRFKRDLRYEINKSLWDQLDLFNQAMTVLHESWYRIMIEHDDKEKHNSYGARYMNGLVASEDFDTYSFTDYITDLKETELTTYTVHNTSSSLIGDSFELELRDSFSENEETCVNSKHIPAQIKKFGVRGFFQGISTLEVEFDKVCFKNSFLTKLVIPDDVIKKGFLLSMENYQLSVQKNNNNQAAMIFHENGKLSHLENVKYDFLLKMFYTCNGKDTFEKKEGCRGPYRFNDSKINGPQEVFLSKKDESPLDFEFPELK